MIINKYYKNIAVHLVDVEFGKPVFEYFRVEEGNYPHTAIVVNDREVSIYKLTFKGVLGREIEEREFETHYYNTLSNLDLQDFDIR